MRSSADRSCIGIKKSKPSHNVEGLSEKELRRRHRFEKPVGWAYKKRHRKELSAEEVAAIVSATRKPYHLYDDVAKQFRVSSQLVSRLAKESERQPEKLEALHRRMKLDEDK